MHSSHGETDPSALRRIEDAERDLQEAEIQDLANADNVALMLTVERLRGALADMIRLNRSTY